jgi:integrase/recombinase XerC
LTLEQLAQAYVAHLQALNRRPATIKLAKRALRNFLAFLGEDRLPTRADVLAYRARLKQSPLSQSTNYGFFQNVRSWLAWAVAQNHLLHNPAEAFRDKAPRKRSRYCPTEAEVARLLDVPENRPADRLALEILYGAGLRRAELCGLGLHDYQRQPPALLVRGGKGQVDRLVPIGDKLQKLLEDYLSNTRPKLHAGPGETALLLDRFGNQFDPNTFAVRFNRLRRRCELPRITIHSLRHAYASHLLANGATLIEIRYLLGHRQLKTTERYTHLHPLELLREYRRTHPRARRKTR